MTHFLEMPSPVSPVSPMYYFGPPHPEALRGLALAPMVGPPAYPYFQAPHESHPDSEADAEENQAKLLKQIEFYFRWLLNLPAVLTRFAYHEELLFISDFLL